MSTLQVDGPHKSDRAPVSGRAWLMLALATVGFAVNFWAWALISPLGPHVPRLRGARRAHRVRRGAAGRGAGARRLARPDHRRCADRPVRRPGDVPARSPRSRSCRCCSSPSSPSTPTPCLLVGGFFLGIAGTAFAVGVPFVNAWFPPERRGLAIGIFGAGMGGTAISALTTVKLFTNVGEKAPFLITAAVLAVYAVVAWLVLRDAPGRVVPTTSLGEPDLAPTRGCRSPGRPASSTPSPSAATSRSRSTCRPTSRPPTASRRPTPPTGWPASWWSR